MNACGCILKQLYSWNSEFANPCSRVSHILEEAQQFFVRPRISIFGFKNLNDILKSIDSG